MYYFKFATLKLWETINYLRLLNIQEKSPRGESLAIVESFESPETLGKLKIYTGETRFETIEISCAYYRVFSYNVSSLNVRIRKVFSFHRTKAIAKSPEAHTLFNDAAYAAIYGTLPLSKDDRSTLFFSSLPISNVRG